MTTLGAGGPWGEGSHRITVSRGREAKGSRRVNFLRLPLGHCSPAELDRCSPFVLVRANGGLATATEDCPFKVVRTNGSDEVLARVINLQIGRAAFETARRMYPRDVLEYRNGAQVMERSGE
jgi:hypothetical protein